MISDLIVLVQMICVIVVAAYLLTRSRLFTEILDGHPSVRAQIVMVLVFGVLSVYGTMSGITILGAEINVRDLGPMVAGLTCGPLVGLGAGLIGAAYRVSLDGFTVWPCSLATVLAGVFGGLVWLASGRKFAGIRISVEFAVLMEGFHMLLVLLMATPYAMALALVSQVAAPMILANAFGVAVFAIIITNLTEERRTRKERDEYLREIERKNTELRIAADIQRSFLPGEIAPVVNFEIAGRSLPAKEVGGDFFDVVPFPVTSHGERKLGLLIADVSGKGIPAALFMALSRVILRVNALWHPHPRDVIGDANHTITEYTTTGMFVTLFYGVLNADARHFRYANAGHNPPLLIRGSTGEILELGTTGIAIGILDDAAYGEQECRFEPGDTLVLYTDGITEAGNQAEEMYGEERLRSALTRCHMNPAREILDEIIADVHQFVAGYIQSDDITVVVVKAVEYK